MEYIIATIFCIFGYVLTLFKKKVKTLNYLGWAVMVGSCVYMLLSRFVFKI